MSPFGAFLAGLLVLAAVVLGGGSASACSCVEPGIDLQQQVDASGVAFTATQIDRRQRPTGVTLVMEVDQVYMGDMDDLVELTTALDEAGCGIDMTGAGLVGIVPHVAEGEWWVSICSGVVGAAALSRHFGGDTEVIPTTTSTIPDPSVAPTLPPGGGAGDGSRLGGVVWPLLLGVAAVGGGVLLLRPRRKAPD